MIRSEAGGLCRVRVAEPVRVEQAEVLDAVGPVANPLLRSIDPGAPQIVDPAQLPGVPIPDSHVIAFQTEPGGVYTLVPER